MGHCSRAGADSASSSLTKLDFGAGERRCHWADWVEVDESCDPGLAPSPASSPPSAPPGLSSPSAQPWEVPRAGWSPNCSVEPCLSQTVSALHLTKVGQGCEDLGQAPGVPGRYPGGTNTTWFSFHNRASHTLIPAPSSQPSFSSFLTLSSKPLQLVPSAPFPSHFLLCPSSSSPAELSSSTQSPSSVP